MAADTNRVAGIDLGTTNSSIAVFEDGRVRVLPNALGEPLTPSVVAWDERERRMLVGRTAKDIWALHPDRGAGLFKRAMGTNRVYRVGPQLLTAIELSALVLRDLKENAERSLGEIVERVVITVPAYFNEDQRLATRQAGERAGFCVERILNEPTAAAIAHGLHRRKSEAVLLVFDLGGGTFDVCVMERFEGNLEVKSVAGESMLGGEDFTRRIAGAALERFGLPFEIAEMEDPEALALLVKRAELLKRGLAGATTGSPPPALRIPPFGTRLKEEQSVPVGAAILDDAFAPLLSRLTGPVRTALRSAHLTRTDVDELILVGGATRLPQVVQLVCELLPVAPHDGVDPDLAVAYGAAIQGALYAREEAVSDLVVTDIASHSLGVDTCKVFGAEHRGGYFSPIIHRGTVIPTSRATTFTTIDANQTVMVLGVYEGEARHVKDNRKIGELRVSGIPKGPPGKGVEVTFTYDLDGILQVDARVRDTGATFSKVFHRTGRELDADEAAAAAARLAELKADPCEAPAVRDLIARAELLLRDVSAEERRQLEQGLDALEHALLDRDAARIEEARAHLESLCQELDGGDRW